MLCGGCADVCPTLCLKLVSLDQVRQTIDMDAAIRTCFGDDVDPSRHSAILKDEDRCIRCGLCAVRCPAEAISMERVLFDTHWRPA